MTWTWDPARNEYRRARSPAWNREVLRPGQDGMVFVGVPLLTADELADAATIARNYARTKVWGPELGGGA